MRTSLIVPSGYPLVKQTSGISVAKREIKMPDPIKPGPAYLFGSGGRI